MSIERGSLERYWNLLGERAHDPPDLGHAWFASNDSCILGYVSLCPVSELWDAVVLVATGSGWAEWEVDPGEFTTLRSAESALVNYMANLSADGIDSQESHDAQAVHPVAHR